MTIWLDVEDLYEYAAVSRRPSGIQRLSFELYRALVAARGEAEVRFCRHDAIEPTLVTVEWAELLALYTRLTAKAEEPPPAPVPPPVPLPLPAAQPSEPPAGSLAPPLPVRKTRRLVEYLPLRVRGPLSQMAQHQKAALRFAFAVLKALFSADQPSAPPTGSLESKATQTEPALALTVADHDGSDADQTAQARLQGRDIRDLAAPGDILLVLGSPWFRANYGKTIGDLRAKLGLRVAVLIYDLIPIIHPEWCDRHLVKMFRQWYYSTVPHVDAFFAISNATVFDMERWAAREKLSLPGAVKAIPIGTGYTEDVEKPLDGVLPPMLSAGGYVLFVSTIEARKNHLLAFRVWRRLLASMPPEEVPTLVFAGRVGWMVADLMQQITNASHLDGKLVVLEEVDDATLSALYRNCRFSLFPSLYEGWGLPVTESLGYGKVCLASNRASVPEAGGDFCLYFDPDDLNDATAAIRGAIENPSRIAALEAKIAAEFRSTAWADAAAALLAGVDESAPARQREV